MHSSEERDSEVRFLGWVLMVSGFYGDFFFVPEPLRTHIIEKCEEEAKVVFGYVDMQDKNYRLALPQNKKEEILQFLFSRAEYYLGNIQDL